MSARPGRTAAKYFRIGIFSRRQVSTMDRMAATFGPACWLPTWIQFFRPRATGRIEFSARLLLSSNGSSIIYLLRLALLPKIEKVHYQKPLQPRQDLLERIGLLEPDHHALAAWISGSGRRVRLSFKPSYTCEEKQPEQQCPGLNRVEAGQRRSSFPLSPLPILVDWKRGRGMESRMVVVKYADRKSVV